MDSDFAPFVQHAGVPSIDIYYGRGKSLICVHNKFYVKKLKVLQIMHITSSCRGRQVHSCVCLCNTMSSIFLFFFPSLTLALFLGVFKKNECLRVYEMSNQILAPIYTEAITEFVSVFSVGIRIAFINFCRLFKQ